MKRSVSISGAPVSKARPAGYWSVQEWWSPTQAQKRGLDGAPGLVLGFPGLKVETGAPDRQLIFALGQSKSSGLPPKPKSGLGWGTRDWFSDFPVSKSRPGAAGHSERGGLPPKPKSGAWMGHPGLVLGFRGLKSETQDWFSDFQVSKSRRGGQLAFREGWSPTQAQRRGLDGAPRVLRFPDLKIKTQDWFSDFQVSKSGRGHPALD